MVRGEEHHGVGNVVGRPQALDRMGEPKLFLYRLSYLPLIALGQNGFGTRQFTRMSNGPAWAAMSWLSSSMPALAAGVGQGGL